MAASCALDKADITASCMPCTKLEAAPTLLMLSILTSLTSRIRDTRLMTESWLWLSPRSSLLASTDNCRPEHEATGNQQSLGIPTMHLWYSTQHLGIRKVAAGLLLSHIPTRYRKGTTERISSKKRAFRM
jgi:hypothetical protein